MKPPDSARRCYRLTTARQLLTERVAEIEALATEQLNEGADEKSVLLGSIALLNLACKDARLTPDDNH